MYIENLALQNYRNYARARLHFPMVSTFYMGITHRERPTYWKLST